MAKRDAKKTNRAQTPSANERAEFEKLRATYRDLYDRKVASEANLKSSEKTLERLSKKALKEYGTDDIEELKKKLAEMRAENDEHRLKYDRHLSEIAAALEKVEQEFQDAKDEAQEKA